jgi:pimeloyl-ACP methyl ester carboxylesterase
MDVQEGAISVNGYQVWYRRVGRGGIPLLLLHGRPGAGQDYLEPLEALAVERLTVADLRADLAYGSLGGDSEISSGSRRFSEPR